jgi:ADP-ribosylglycohydrolase
MQEPITLESKYAGCMTGIALANAVAFPMEKFSRQLLRETLGEGIKELLEHTSGLCGAGQYSDDVQVPLTVLESLVEKGQFDIDDIAWRLRTLYERRELVGCEKHLAEAIQSLLEGVRPERAGTAEGIPGTGTAKAIPPVALLFHEDRSGLAQKCLQLGRMFHHDPRSTAGAVAVAFTIAHNLEREQPDRALLTEELGDIIGKLDSSFASAIERLPAWLEGQDPDEMIREIAACGADGDSPPPGGDGIPNHVVPAVLVSLLSFLRTPLDYAESVRFAILASGPIDLTSALTGALSGSLVGVEGIPYALAKQIHDRGRKGFDYIRLMAEKLYRQK